MTIAKHVYPGYIGASNTPFDISLEITRPTNTDTYAAQDLLNGTATTLPYFDFGVANANRKIIINYASIMTPNYAASLKPTLHFKLYGVNSPIASCADNAAFNPTYTALKNRLAGFIDADAIPVPVGSGAYCLAWTKEQKIATLDANGRLYLAAIFTNAYVPLNAETFYARITGFLQ